MRISGLLGATLAAVAVSMPVVAANLIVNGGFEQPVQQAGGYTLLAPNSGFTGWQVVGAPGNVAPISGAYRSGAVTFPSQEGAQWLDMTGLSNTATGVEQTVTTVPGTTYDVTFYVGNVAAGGWGTSSAIEVLVDGRPIGTATNNAGAGLNTQVWQRFTQSFTATGASTTITFINRDPRNDNTNGLDNVSLVAHGQAQVGCAEPPATKKKANPFAALAALAGGAVAVKQASHNASATEQQVLNTMNNVAAASGGSPAAAAAGDCVPSGSTAGGGAAATMATATMASAGAGTGAAAAATTASAMGAAAAGSAAMSQATAAAPAASGAKRSARAPDGTATESYPDLITSDAPATAGPQGNGPSRPMPDVIGLKLGMSPQEVHAALKKRYPKSRIDVGTYYLAPYAPEGANVPESFTIGWNELGIPEERISVHFTPPPGKQVAWRIQRVLNRQQIYRANALSSLREKYGRESVAFATSYTATRDDSQIGFMFWVLDRQGRPAPLPSSSSPYSLYPTLSNECAAKFTDTRGEPGAQAFAPTNFSGDSFTKQIAAGGWCNTAGLMVTSAVAGTQEVIQQLVVELVDVPTATAAARAEGEWMQRIARGQQQQQIDAAKQNKPQL